MPAFACSDTKDTKFKTDSTADLGVMQLNFNMLIFMDVNLALHKTVYVKSGR